MANQEYQKLKIECDDLEWLYVPDEVYADYDGCKRCLQLFIPYRQKLAAEETFPLVLFIPGSAWYRQEVYNSLPAYSRLAERGIVTAILQFRESTIAPFPAQVEDAKAALRFLAARAEDYHIDTERIFIAGNSSGGHIALMTAFTEAQGIFDTPMYQEVPCRIKGVIAQSAPSDIMKCAKEPLPPGFPESFRPTRDLLGVKEVLESPELAEAASCGKYISKLPNCRRCCYFMELMTCMFLWNTAGSCLRCLKEPGRMRPIMKLRAAAMEERSSGQIGYLILWRHL